jgi:hypothetical protein
MRGMRNLRRQSRNEPDPDLQALMDCLKDAQHVLLDQAAASDMLPSEGELRRIAKLENAIAAVAALIEERREHAGF